MPPPAQVLGTTYRVWIHAVDEKQITSKIAEEIMEVTLKPRRKRALEAAAPDEALADLSEEDAPDPKTLSKEQKLQQKKERQEKQAQERKKEKERLVLNKKSFALAGKAQTQLEKALPKLLKAVQVLEKKGGHELLCQSLREQHTKLAEWKSAATSLAVTFAKNTKAVLPDLPFSEHELKNETQAGLDLAKPVSAKGTVKPGAFQTFGPGPAPADPDKKTAAEVEQNDAVQKASPAKAQSAAESPGAAGS